MADQPDVSHDADAHVDRLRHCSLAMIWLAESALVEATAALADADSAERCRPTFDDLLVSLHDELEAHSAVILAAAGRCPPIVDRRGIVVGVQVNTDVECLGELARSIADVAGSRQAKPSVPAELDAIVGDMGRRCVAMLGDVAAAVQSGCPPPVRHMEQSRDAVGDSLWELYGRLLALRDTIDVRTGIDVCLVGRCLSRTADHTVSLARHLALLHDPAPAR